MKSQKTHFYWQFCHPTFSFVVGILFCSHYLLFLNGGRWVFVFFPMDLDFLFFFVGMYRNMDLDSYWRFLVGCPIRFLSEGESLRILHPFRGTIALLNT